ncbi:hypothetical protein AMATHDRAFT_68465 [Amanita thiersii Skay4041]|uniref:Uncharacterized protein n=1 Tax=Amanita thiersii Skay4041 TaxID=703135 RepID=A0A2A9NH82_9AGAR|nr:hypothetical protein AMATHDRAFT_68465 [Amanita thiersii Skay4041]
MYLTRIWLVVGVCMLSYSVSGAPLDRTQTFGNLAPPALHRVQLRGRNVFKKDYTTTRQAHNLAARQARYTRSVPPLAPIPAPTRPICPSEIAKIELPFFTPSECQREPGCQRRIACIWMRNANECYYLDEAIRRFPAEIVSRMIP